MRPPNMQRMVQAMGVPMASNQRSAKEPRKYPMSVMPPWNTPKLTAWSMARLYLMPDLESPVAIATAKQSIASTIAIMIISIMPIL